MRDFLTELDIRDTNFGAACGAPIETHGDVMESRSPVDGALIGRVKMANARDYERVVQRTLGAFEAWRAYPAPKRGELVRQMGMLLRDRKRALGRLVSYEMGKIAAEGEGEVQEMIDMADLAVGMSRQLYGQVIESERAKHRLLEQWHPLGAVGIISAFNFPVAVWSWNAFVAAVCGDVMIWKPSRLAPLCAVAVQNLVHRVLADAGFDGVMSLVIGTDDEVGERLIRDERIPLISATGSCRMGRHVGQVVAGRFGRTILELGGNNAVVVTANADLDMATRAILFGAVGTAGQRCTTTRRLFVHESVADELTERLIKAYLQVKIGDPLAEGTLMGPLINAAAVQAMQKALAAAKEQGGKVLTGGEVLSGKGYESGNYVTPAIVRAKEGMAIVQEETFAPILYVHTYTQLEDAIRAQNGVAQGLSSAIFTDSLREAETFLSSGGSDCGIANVNIGTSGAEIGGAFGGEKHTGGGREAGSDAWKAYMRRQTQTINWSRELPLAQGISFG